MNSRDGLSVCGYIRQNFEQKCLIDEIIRTIIQFFKNTDGFLKRCTVPTLVQSVNDIVDTAALGDHTMLVDREGSLWAFGRGDNGRLGTGNNENVKVPQQIHLKHRAISVCVGQRHSLILAECGSVLSCGDNTLGQLGQGDTKRQSALKVIEALNAHNIIQISAGFYHNGALNKKGALFMWGSNYYGQCGVGKNKGNKIETPTMIKLNEKVNMIECGSYHSLLITMNNLLYSFGCGNSYQLGYDAEESKYVPTLVEALKDVNIVKVAGGGSHTLCVDDKFNVWAFGRNWHGQCAQPESIEEQMEPKQIEYFKTNKLKAKQVAAGHRSSCVIAQNDECFVFGNNDYYQIGLVWARNYFVPTKLPLFVQKVSMGEYHSAFISNYKKE